MRRYQCVILGLCLLGLSVAGCSDKASERPTNRPAAGHPEELADSTRLDSARPDLSESTPESIPESTSTIDSGQ